MQAKRMGSNPRINMPLNIRSAASAVKFYNIYFIHKAINPEMSLQYLQYLFIKQDGKFIKIS